MRNGFLRRPKRSTGMFLDLSRAGISGSSSTSAEKRSKAAVPGVQMFCTLTQPGVGGARNRTGKKQAQQAKKEALERLTLGIVRRLIRPRGEWALLKGCRHLIEGHDRKAIECLPGAVGLTDGAFLAGFLALKKGYLEEAGQLLRLALRDQKRLGRHFNRYQIDATVSLPLSDGVITLVGPDARGVLFGLARTNQRQRRWEDALVCLGRLRELAPNELAVRLSMAEILMETLGDREGAAGMVIQLSEGIANDSPLAAALLLHRAKALMEVGLASQARDLLSLLLRRKKDRPSGLILAMRYERALAYEAMGQAKRARSDLEAVYAEAPRFEDVAARLGFTRRGSQRKAA